MKFSELINYLNYTLNENGDQEVIIVVNSKRFTEIELYTDDEKELLIVLPPYLGPDIA